MAAPAESPAVKECEWCTEPFRPRRASDRFCPGGPCRTRFHEYNRPRVRRQVLQELFEALEPLTAEPPWWARGRRREIGRALEALVALRAEIGADRESAAARRRDSA